MREEMPFADKFKELASAFDDYRGVTFYTYYGSIENNAAKYTKAIDSLRELYFFQSFLLDSQYKKIFKNVPDALMLQFSKTAVLTQSIHQSLSVGLQIPANILLRSLFEVFVDTKVLTERDTEYRCKLYSNYYWVSSWLHLNGYQKLKTKQPENEKIANTFNNLFPQEKKDQIESNYNEVKADYHSIMPYHWAWKIYRAVNKNKNPTTKFLCRQLGLEEDYLRLYSLSSAVVHNSPLQENLIKKGGVTTIAPIFNQNTDATAGMSLNYAIEIILLIIKNESNYDYVKQFLKNFISYFLL